MGSKLYVGNLSYNTTSSDLEQLCPHGTVQRRKSSRTGTPAGARGSGSFRWAAMPRPQAAIAALNGQEVDGRALTVNEAKPREDRPARGGGGGGGGYGGGGGGGRGGGGG